MRAIYLLASAAGTCSFVLFRAARQGIESNLAVALPDLSKAKRRSLALEAFRNDARNWADTLRIPSLRPEQVKQLVRIHGWDHLEGAVAAGKGVIMVTIHLGNFDLVGQLVAARGLRLTVPVERMAPERLFQYLVELRSAKGITLIPVENAVRPMLGALRRGEIVGMAADRNIAGRGIDVQVFGRPTTLARSPASLARLTGAPIVVGVGIRRRTNDFDAYVMPAYYVNGGEDEEADERAATEFIASRMEDLIRRYPAQWLAFVPLWDDGTAADTPATIEQQKKAAV